jgi:hypothetical protein
MKNSMLLDKDITCNIWHVLIPTPTFTNDGAHAEAMLSAALRSGQRTITQFSRLEPHPDGSDTT